MILELKNCPVCNESRFVFDRNLNTYVCRKCGYIVPSLKYVRYDTPFQKEEEKKIDIKSKSNIDKNGRIVKGYQTSYEKYIKDFHHIFLEVQSKFPSLKTVDIKTAKKLLKMYLSKTKRKKQRIKKKTLAIALLYLATKLNNTHQISLKKIEKEYKVENIKSKNIKRIYKHLLKTLEIKVSKKLDEEGKVILTRFRKEYGRDEKVEMLIKSLYKAIEKKKIGIGRSKKTVYAAIAYISYKLYEYNVTQKKAASLAEITEIPLREMIKEILRKIHIEIHV